MSRFWQIPDKAINHKAYMVYSITMIWSVVTGVIVSLGFIVFPEVWYRWLIFLLTSVFMAVFNLYLNYIGKTNLASWTLSIIIWLYITLPCFTAGGIQAPGIISQMSVILSIGFLLGWKGGLLFGILSIAIDFVFVYLEMNGLLPELQVHHTPLSRWIGAIIPFGTIIALQYYATNHLQSSIQRMENEIRLRQMSDSSRQSTFIQLQERVKELNAICEISKILQYNEHLNVDVLREIAHCLAKGMQFPEVTKVQIAIDNDHFEMDGYKRMNDMLSSRLNTVTGSIISINIIYGEKRPDANLGPFLKEEQTLIDTISEMIRTAVERQESLKELNDYKYAIDVSSIVAISNVEGNYTYVNDNFCRISQFDSKELIGKNFQILQSVLNPNEKFEDIQNRLSEGQYVRSEFCSVSKNGQTYWVDSTIVPFMDENNQVYQYLSINHDITERKLAEEKIKNNELFLRKITSQVPGNTYVFEINDEGYPQLNFVNKGTDKFNHQYEVKELFEDSNKLQQVLHPDDREFFREKMLEAKRVNGPISIQYRMVVNGQTRWRWMQGVSEKQSDGKVFWYAATSDITPLIEYISSIEQMIFDVSHVLRRPITNLMSIAYLLSNTTVEQKDWKKLSEYMDKSIAEIDKFLNTLNESYSKKRHIHDFNIKVDTLIDKRSTLFMG